MFNEKFSKKHPASKKKIVQRFAEGGPVRKTLEVDAYDRGLGKNVLGYMMNLDEKFEKERGKSGRRFEQNGARLAEDVSDEVRGKKPRGSLSRLVDDGEK